MDNFTVGIEASGSGNSFNDWIAHPDYGLAAAEQGFLIDPDGDGDGLPNGIEAWFGTHPDQSGAGIANRQPNFLGSIISD